MESALAVASECSVVIQMQGYLRLGVARLLMMTGSQQKVHSVRDDEECNHGDCIIGTESRAQTVSARFHRR